MEKSKVIFGNKISIKTYKSGLKTKQKYIKKYGDDSEVSYPIQIEENEPLGKLIGVKTLQVVEQGVPCSKAHIDENKGIIVGGISAVVL